IRRTARLCRRSCRRTDPGVARHRALSGPDHRGRRASAGAGRAAGRLRLGVGQWLPLRPRHLRAVAAVGAVALGPSHFHGDGHPHGLRYAAWGLTIMTVLMQFVIGLIFGLGLIVSGMSNPLKVLNFLDFAAIRTGSWDASLAFVMAGAIAVTFIGFKLA